MDKSSWLCTVNQMIDTSSEEDVVNYIDKSPHFILSPNIKRRLLKKYPHLVDKYSSNRQVGDVEFEFRLATKFKNKYQNAKERGLDFNISLASLRNMMKAKKCYFSGLPLTPDTFTIDRVDSEKGYVKGNVVACHTLVNTFKSHVEDRSYGLGREDMIKVLTRWEKRERGMK